MRVRRTAGSLAVACLGLTLAVPVAAAAEGEPLELTLLATTDTHGHVVNWDYFADAPYAGEDTLGLARVGTVVDQVRAAKGEDSVVVVDNGDAIQGTPLTYLYGMGRERPGVLSGATTHPMAEAFNAIGYDAQVVGNHEYNYGLDLLRAYEEDLDAPLLGANVVDVATDQPYHQPWTTVTKTVGGQPVRVGVVGLVTPGVRVWDRQHVEGVLEFEDMVTTARAAVADLRAAEDPDVVVVLAHTGKGTVPDGAYDPAALPEDVVNNIAVQVPGIDVIVAGHSHQDAPAEVYTNVDGGKVLVTQPYYWARSVTETTLRLVPSADGGLEVDWSAAGAPVVEPHYGHEIAAESDAVLAAVADEHRATVDYVNTPVADSVTELPATTSRYEDTAIIDFINHVQAETVEAALEGTPYADLPVLSQASPFSRTAVFPQGEVTIRDIAGLYIFENTLRGVTMTGAELADYLEYSARYFVQVEEGATFDPVTGTNAAYPDRPQGVPDYNYDVLSGVRYTIDVSRPVGERIRDLSGPDGTPVADDDRFVLAVNNYRQSGGGAFPHVADAEVVYDELLEIRQLLIDWASARGSIDPADFFDLSWTLTTSTPEPTPTPTPTPTPDPSPGPAAPSPTTTPSPVAGAGGGDTGAGNGATASAAGTGTRDRAALGALAVTGADALGLGALTVALLLVGAALWTLSRRRALR